LPTALNDGPDQRQGPASSSRHALTISAAAESSCWIVTGRRSFRPRTIFIRQS
jgi:hypothetical protein